MSHRITPLVLIAPDGYTRYHCLYCDKPVARSYPSEAWRHHVREWRPGTRHPRSRYCRRCDEVYPLDKSFFRVHRMGKSGPIWQCLACQREHNRKSWERRRGKAA